MATTVNQSTMRNYSKRTQIVAAWLIDPDFDRQRAADALSVSYEYIRQVVTDLESEECEMVEDCVMLERLRSSPIQLRSVSRRSNAKSTVTGP